jgi:predicted acyltransferase
MSSAVTEKSNRIVSMDQLRGYAIFGMILVNAKGMFGVKFEQISHFQDRFTYADTVAPLFMFVVGMSMRLSWLRRSEQVGAADTRKAMFKRFFLLTMMAFALYMGWLWDALMDIGLAGLLAIMLIDKAPKIRVAAAFVMALAYQALVSFTVYGPWIMRTGKITKENMPYLFKWIPYRGDLFDVAINGGPFGPLSWCFILLLGTIAYDVMSTKDTKKIVITCLSWGLGLCAAAWIVSVPWGETKVLWPISAYHMTLPFPLWSTGLCFLSLLFFHILCDRVGVRIPTFTAVGMNPLFIYILQILVAETQAPRDLVKMIFGWVQTPLLEANPSLATPVGICGILAFYGMLAGLAYVLHRKTIYIKI